MAASSSVADIRASLPGWSNEDLWEPSFDLLRKQAVVNLYAVGRLPEIVVALTGNHYVSSSMTADGDPSSALFDRRGDTVRWLRVREGRLDIAEEGVASKAAKQT